MLRGGAQGEIFGSWGHEGIDAGLTERICFAGDHKAKPHRALLWAAFPFSSPLFCDVAGLGAVGSRG